MLLMIILFSILLFLWVMFNISEGKGLKVKVYLLLFIDIILLSSILFLHYLGIFGIFIPIFFLILNIFYTVSCSKEYKQKRLFSNLLIPIISIFLFLNNVDDKIALNIELNKAKSKLEKLLKEEKYDAKGIYIENNLYAFTYFSGVVDNWAAIIYDNSGILENGIMIIENNENYMNIEIYQEIRELFGGDLYSIQRLEENWYLCLFT